MRGLAKYVAVAIVLCAGTILGARVHAAETLTLEEATDRALRTAPALESAVAQGDLGDARVNEARAPLYPNLAANAEYNQAPGYDQVISNRGLTLAQLELGYTAYDGGRRSDQVRSARYQAEAAALGVNTARAQIVFDVAVAYFDLMRQQESEKEIAQSLDRLDGYLRIVDSLQRSGRAIANDVLKIRATRDAGRLMLATVREAGAHSSIVLGSMIGLFDRSDLEVAEVATLPSPPNGEISESPVYKAAARQVEAARLAVRAAEAERSPTLRIALTSGWEGVDPPKTFGHHLGASYDGAVSVPIFEGGLIQSHVDEAKAAERTAIAQQRQVEIDLKRDFADAGERYRSAREQLALLAQSQSTADDSFALDWARFLGGGSVTVLEATDAYQQAENLRLARFDQEFAARQAAAQARLLLGLSE
jgi:outer membrane protein TolC